MSPARSSFNHRGFDEMRLRGKRATGRALVGIGVATATETKVITHRVSGTLARSTHAAPINELHEQDEDRARGEDLGVHVPHPTPLLNGWALEVGSWLPYACVEWVGRGHPGITQGLEMVRGQRADRIVVQAFREEGL